MEAKTVLKRKDMGSKTFLEPKLIWQGKFGQQNLGSRNGGLKLHRFSLKVSSTILNLQSGNNFPTK